MQEYIVIGMMVSALSTLFGLFVVVGKPIINLNSTIIKAIARIDDIETRQKENKQTLKDMQEKSRESHKRIHDRIDDVEKDVTELRGRVDSLSRR